MARVVFIYIAPDATTEGHRSVRNDALHEYVFVGVPGADAAADLAPGLVAEGAQSLELVSGMGPAAAAQVLLALAGGVPVGVTGQSTEARGLGRTGVVYLAGAGGTPLPDPVTGGPPGEETVFAAASGAEDAAEVSLDLVARGIARIELCGAFGPVLAAPTVEALAGLVPVSLVGFGAESVAGAAAVDDRYPAGATYATSPEAPGTGTGAQA